MTTKREIMEQAVEAARTVWTCPGVDGKDVDLVILQREHAAALVQGTKLALAFIDRATDPKAIEEALK